MLSDSPPTKYDFTFVGDEQNSYYFTTAKQGTYSIRFVPSAYLFEEYIEDTVDAREMIIAVADNPNGRFLPGDPLIGPTVRAIFMTFSSAMIR